jgi:hypothetical protein
MGVVIAYFVVICGKNRMATNSASIKIKDLVMEGVDLLPIDEPTRVMVS